MGFGWLDDVDVFFRGISPASGVRTTFLLVGLDLFVYPAFDRAAVKSLRSSLSLIPKSSSFESFSCDNAAVVLHVL